MQDSPGCSIAEAEQHQNAAQCAGMRAGACSGAEAAQQQNRQMSELVDARALWSRVVVVTQRHACTGGFLPHLELLVAQHPRMMILREKDLDAAAYRALAQQVARICARQHVPLVLNGHPEALAWNLLPDARGFAAVQLGMAQARELLRTTVSAAVCSQQKTSPLHLQPVPLGVSVHSVAEAVEAERLGAAWLIAGHIFPTTCKPGLPPRGLAFLRDVIQAVHIPVYAIGGLDLCNAPQALACGAAGVCMMSHMMRWRPEQE